MTEDNNDPNAVEPANGNSGDSQSPSGKPDYFSPGKDNAKLVYILYFISLIPVVLMLVRIPIAGILGLAAIVGVIFALMNKSAAEEWVASHYEFQFHTFWKGIVISIVGAITIPILIGFIIYIGLVVWLAVRTYKGMEYLDQDKAHPDPNTWVFE